MKNRPLLLQTKNETYMLRWTDFGCFSLGQIRISEPLLVAHNDPERIKSVGCQYPNKNCVLFGASYLGKLKGFHLCIFQA